MAAEKGGEKRKKEKGKEGNPNPIRFRQSKKKKGSPSTVREKEKRHVETLREGKRTRHLFFSSPREGVPVRRYTSCREGKLRKRGRPRTGGKKEIFGAIF